MNRTTVTVLQFYGIPLCIERYEFDVANEKKSDLRSRGRPRFRPDIVSNDYLYAVTDGHGTNHAHTGHGKASITYTQMLQYSSTPGR